MNRIKDRDFKKLFYSDCVFPDKTIKPDAVFKLNSSTSNNLMCLEYENSSRGMTYHTAKYINFAYKNPSTKVHVCFIRSLFHQSKHELDYVYSKTLTISVPKNVQFYYIDDPLDNEELFYTVDNLYQELTFIG